MSLFIGRVKVKDGETACGDPSYQRFWLKIGNPLQHYPPSDKATAMQDEAAKELLKETLLQCKKLMPETRRYLLTDFTYDVGYLGTLFKLRNQLEKERWCDACYTLCKVIKYYCANDVRTMYTIIGVLEEYV